MHYRELAPDADLAQMVDRLWILEGDTHDLAAQEQPILPDGCPELIIHFGDAFVRSDPDGTEQRQPHVLFAGQLTGPLLIRPTGRVSVLGIRFRPYGAAAVLKVPQVTLAGLTIAVESVAGPLARSLDAVRNTASTPNDAVALVQASLRAHAVVDRIDRTTQRVADRIIRTGGLASISRLTRATGLSPRQVQRRFLDAIGVPPKRLARIVRFTNALRTLDTLQAADRGTRTAADHGYADQAHFARDFRAFAGCSPTSHLLNKSELTGFFTQDRHAHRAV